MDWLNKYTKEKPVKKGVLDILKKFFGKSIELRVSSKIKNEIADMFKDQIDYGMETEAKILIAKAELEKQINLAKTDLRNAKKLYKKGDMDRDTLFDYEYRLVELRMQLDELLNKLNGK
jgi:hypothetical protein